MNYTKAQRQHLMEELSSLLTATDLPVMSATDELAATVIAPALMDLCSDCNALEEELERERMMVGRLTVMLDHLLHFVPE